MSAREDFITDYCAQSGKTREQAEAFLAVLGSGMAKRGIWPEARILTEKETSDAVKTFIGEANSDA